MKIEALKKVAVIGAGDMGHGIAQVALMGGYDVNLCDVKMEFVERGISRIYESLDKLASKGRFPVERVEEIRQGKLKGYDSIAEGVKDADFIIEVVPERIPIKESVLGTISENCKEDAIIASNTSTMSITMLSGFVKHPENFVGTHYFNPPALMKLVEVVKGEKTSEETAEFARSYVKKAGKTLVYAQKDTPGFIANRVALPIILYNGCCLDIDGLTPEDIDISMHKVGDKMGHFEMTDFSGLDVQNACLEYYHDNLHTDYVASKTALEHAARGAYGKKTGSGYYDWADGKRPVLDESKWTGKYKPELVFFIEANEATKLVEEGVCTLQECDTAMLLGYSSAAPVAAIQEYEPAYVAAELNKIADRFGKEVFRPTQTIIDGGYKF